MGEQTSLAGPPGMSRPRRARGSSPMTRAWVRTRLTRKGVRKRADRRASVGDRQQDRAMEGLAWYRACGEQPGGRPDQGADLFFFVIWGDAEGTVVRAAAEGKRRIHRRRLTIRPPSGVGHYPKTKSRNRITALLLDHSRTTV